MIYFNAFLKKCWRPKRIFSYLLKQINLPTLSGVLLIDANYFGKERCVIYYNYHCGTVPHYRVSKGELFSEIRKDVETFNKNDNNGHQLKDVVSDGKEAIKQAVLYIKMKYFTPKKQVLPHQCCLRHLKFQCLTFITQHPKIKGRSELKRNRLILN